MRAMNVINTIPTPQFRDTSRRMLTAHYQPLHSMRA